MKVFLLPYQAFEDAHIQKIASAYLNFETIEGFSKVVNLDEIKENASKLSISLYVRRNQTDEAEDTDLESCVLQWQECSRIKDETIGEIIKMLGVNNDNDNI